MGPSVVPALIDALVSTATDVLPTVLVSDGFGITDDPGDFLMVGIDDPATEVGETADVTQTQLAFGATRPRMESGVIHMVARSVNGDADQKAARDAAYAIVEALATELRTTNDLGVDGVQKLGNGASLRLMQAQGPYGAMATLMYDIAFDAVI